MRWSLLLLGLLGCGDAPAVSPLEDPAEAVAAAPTEEPGADPLLARARASLANGELEPDVRDEILASGEPVHARARRVLGAMERGPPSPDEGSEIPIAPPQLPPGRDDGSLPEVSPATPPPHARAPTDAAPPPGVAPPAEPAKPKRRVSKMSLAKKKGGATLTLHAGSGLVVGVANRRESGIIHLVVDASGADAKVLSSRPRVTGAHVSAVRKTGGSLFITLELDPGWRLGAIRSFKGGARIQLTESVPEG